MEKQIQRQSDVAIPVLFQIWTEIGLLDVKNKKLKTTLSQSDF